MSSEPVRKFNTPASLDDALERVVRRFREAGRIDMGPEVLRAALRDRLNSEGFSESEIRLLEVNLMGSISGWMEFILEERRSGRNVVNDFARHLRTAFLAHCREHKVEPEEAVAMSIELASAIMELACAFKRQLSFGSANSGSEEADI